MPAQLPSGRAGMAGGMGGARCLVADIRATGVGKGTTNSGWTESRGWQGAGAHFSSARNQVKRRWTITGYTRDSTGAILGNCAVTLFTTVDNMPIEVTTSDAAGYYSFNVNGNSQLRFAVSYKAGAPDVTGATVNTLVPVLV